MKTHNLHTALVLTVLTISSMRPARANFVFGPAENSGLLINTSVSEIEPTPQRLELWFGRRVGTTDWDYWTVSRITEDGPWENPVNHGAWTEASWNLLEVSASYTTSDGLELYYSASEERRSEGYGGYDLYMKKRDTIADDWGPAINLGPEINGPYDEALPSISPDGLELYFSGWSRDARPGGYGRADLWVIRRDTREEPWGEPVNLDTRVNTPQFDARPKLVADGLLLFFESDRPDGFGSVDLYMMRRTTISSPWSEPVNLGPHVNSAASDEQGFLSPDGSTLYFHSNRPGGYGKYDIWQASLVPIVDLNGDGQVNGGDVLVISDAWGTDSSLCDLGPFVWGDGVIDVKDLEAIAGYVGANVDDPTLVAHWACDAQEGMTAFDSVGNREGDVLGTPTWVPGGGQIDGALECSGDDVVVTHVGFDASSGPFSVLAWAQGGGPGQVVVSQQSGHNWLMADAVDGSLKTELTSGNRDASDLTSTAVITDGGWHRVGLVWDGTSRRLYVDSELVAEDTQDALKGSSKSILLGCGKNMSPATFWTGRIDDVRVYNRIVQP